MGRGETKTKQDQPTWRKEKEKEKKKGKKPTKLKGRVQKKRVTRRFLNTKQEPAQKECTQNA